MSVYYPTSTCGGGAIPQYTCNPCPDYEYGRVRSIAFVKNSVSFTDPTSHIEWNTALGAGNAIVIWATQGNYDGGTSQELPGFGDAEFVNGGVSHVVVYKDASTTDNCDFYNSIKNSTEYTMWFRTSTKIWSAGAPVNITPKMPIADDLKSVVTYEVTVKWQNADLPCPYDIPDGIFENCYIPIVA
jgi:hypothetical protein